MNKEEYNARARGYYHKNKSKDENFLKRKNDLCRANYDERIKDDDFKENKRKRDLEYYHKNKNKLVENQIERRRKLLNEAKEKLGGECVWCGVTENLEFDHIDDSIKEHNVGNAVRNNKDVFWKEVCKCQLLCVECHNKKTTAQKKAKQKMWLNLSFGERQNLVDAELCQFMNCPN
tara:strand:+ start:259 stop:786 length:528 start_codon:yes stop_codon:yes gene_type:complete